MFEKQVLDKGFVRLLNISGAVRRNNTAIEGAFGLERPEEFIFDATDTDPALVARTSFAKGLQEHTKEQDEALVEYLIRNNHNSPFEFTTVYMELKLPIFVARQIMRHRACTFNEVSGRYVTLPDDWYIPEVVRGKHSGGNKQGSEDNLPRHTQDWFQVALIADCDIGYENYIKALVKGVCPEQARMFLHLNHYTQFVWKQDLHNLMHFLSLRLDEHAQWETRQYAEAIYGLLKELLPKSMEWFDEYRRKLVPRELQMLLNIIESKDVATEEELELLKKLAKRNGVKL
jgi:thymidylate synthase (FAD)